MSRGAVDLAGRSAGHQASLLSTGRPEGLHYVSLEDSWTAASVRAAVDPAPHVRRLRVCFHGGLGSSVVTVFVREQIGISVMSNR